MKLGEWLKEYRRQHGLSMQNFADSCGFSKAYVSMLEKGVNPTTNKPVSPTMQTFEKIAKATGQDVDTLIKILDNEQLITIKPFDLDEKRTELLKGYDGLNADGQILLIGMLNLLRESHGKKVAVN